MGLHGTFSENPEGFVKKSQLDASHLCSNFFCYDHFHIIPEIWYYNNSRHACVVAVRDNVNGYQWLHEPKCLLDMIQTRADRANWKNGRAECEALTGAGGKKKVYGCRMCRDSHCDSRASLRHWKSVPNGLRCDKGGYPVAKYMSMPDEILWLQQSYFLYF